MFFNFINGLPKNRVQQLHISGHDNRKTHIIDTHDNDIVKEVWSLYENALQHFGKVSTLIERDDNIPDLLEMEKELSHAKSIYQKIVVSEQVV